MLVVGHDHGNMAVGSIVLSVVPIGKLIGTRKSEFAGTPPLTQSARHLAHRKPCLGMDQSSSPDHLFGCQDHACW